MFHICMPQLDRVVKRTKAHPYFPYAGCTLHCGTSSWQQWWGEMSRWHFSRGTYFPDVGHHTRKQWYLQNNWVNEWKREAERSVKPKKESSKYIQKTSKLLTAVARRNISRSYLFQWLGLLCSHCKWTAPLPADLGSVECDCCVHICQNILGQRGKHSLVSEQRLRCEHTLKKPRGRSGRYTAEGNIEHVAWRILGEQQMLEPLLEK